MAASMGDVIRVIVNQTQAGQTIQNVYHYQVVTLTGLEGDYLQVVIDWVVNEVIPPVAALQSDALEYVSVFAINVTNNVDFKEQSLLGSAGAITGDAMPPNVTYTFRLIRETLATRHGYKRFAGVPESKQSNGSIQAVTDTQITAITDALAADIQPAPSVVPLLAPVIVRKSATGTVVAVNNVGSADFRGIGTQNTRKIGRGI